MFFNGDSYALTKKQKTIFIPFQYIPEFTDFTCVFVSLKIKNCETGEQIYRHHECVLNRHRIWCLIIDGKRKLLQRRSTTKVKVSLISCFYYIPISTIDQFVLLFRSSRHWCRPPYFAADSGHLWAWSLILLSLVLILVSILTGLLIIQAKSKFNLSQSRSQTHSKVHYNHKSIYLYR